MPDPRISDHSLPGANEVVAMEEYPSQNGRTFTQRDARTVQEEVRNLEDSRSSTSPVLPEYTEREHMPQSKPKRHFRPRYLIALVVLYCCLTVIPWVIICVQNKRPITAHTYDYRSDHYQYGSYLRKKMQDNVRWFDAMRVFLSIAHTLVIPVTLMVCAGAAVIYSQSLGPRHRLNMQQLCALGDQGGSEFGVRFGGLRLKGPHFWLFTVLTVALGQCLSTCYKSKLIRR